MKRGTGVETVEVVLVLFFASATQLSRNVAVPACNRLLQRSNLILIHEVFLLCLMQRALFETKDTALKIDCNPYYKK
jgi:hypothetical protein